MAHFMFSSDSLTVRIFKRVITWIFRLFLIYAGILVIGLIPYNNDFVSTEGGIDIFVISNEVHADIILPIQQDGIDWKEFLPHLRSTKENQKHLTHLAIGWGDKGFFLETPTWDDFRLSTASSALFLPTESCMHVDLTRPDFYDKISQITISTDQYRRLVQTIKASFATNQKGIPILIPDYAYTDTDCFYEAVGHYHLFNTCNSWVGNTLGSAGVQVPWLSPMPKTPDLYLKSRDE